MKLKNNILKYIDENSILKMNANINCKNIIYKWM